MEKAFLKGIFFAAASSLDGLNRFTYCKNNPVKYTDPTGNIAFVIPAAIGVAELATYALAALGIITVAHTAVTYGPQVAKSIGTAINHSTSDTHAETQAGAQTGNPAETQNATKSQTLTEAKADATTQTKDDSKVTLFRATSPLETAQILATKSFININGLETKYFSITIQGAQKEGTILNKAFKDGPYTVFGTSIPKDLITPDMLASVDGGVLTIVVPTEKLSELSTPVYLGPAENSVDSISPGNSNSVESSTNDISGTSGSGNSSSKTSISGNRGSGTNGSQGGSIICTELYKQGLMDEWIYRADEKFGAYLHSTQPDVMKGYYFIAKPIVTCMKKSKLFTSVVNAFAKPWSYEMAHRTGDREKGEPIGYVIMTIGIPLCSFIGAVISNHMDFQLILSFMLFIIVILVILKYYLYEKRNLVYLMDGRNLKVTLLNFNDNRRKI